MIHYPYKHLIHHEFFNDSKLMQSVNRTFQLTLGNRIAFSECTRPWFISNRLRPQLCSITIERMLCIYIIINRNGASFWLVRMCIVWIHTPEYIQHIIINVIQITYTMYVYKQYAQFNWKCGTFCVLTHLLTSTHSRMKIMECMQMCTCRTDDEDPR